MKHKLLRLWITLCIIMCMSEQAAFGIPQWTIGDRLAKALDFAGMSRAEMADYLECSPNTVTNYTSNKTRVPGAVLRLWSMRTGVPREWIEDGITPPHGDGGATMSATNGYRTTRRTLARVA